MIKLLKIMGINFKCKDMHGLIFSMNNNNYEYIDLRHMTRIDPKPKLRFYLQKTLFDDINKEIQYIKSNYTTDPLQII